MTSRRTLAKLARQIEANTLPYSVESLQPIMALLGYEVGNHGRLGIALRKFGESHWQSMPRFSDADDAALYLHPRCTLGRFDDIQQDEQGIWHASFLSKTHGNDYGNSDSLGRAMWAGFVRAEGNT